MNQNNTDPTIKTTKHHQGKHKLTNVIQILDVTHEHYSHQKHHANYQFTQSAQITAKQNVPGYHKQKNKATNSSENLRMVRIIEKKMFWQDHIPGEESLRSRKIKYLVQFSDGTRVYKTTNELKQFYSQIADFEQKGRKHKKVKQKRNWKQRLQHEQKEQPCETKKKNHNLNNSVQVKENCTKQAKQVLIPHVQNENQQNDNFQYVLGQQVQRYEKPKKKNRKEKIFQIVLQRLQEEVGQVEYCNKQTEKIQMQQSFENQNKKQNKTHKKKHPSEDKSGEENFNRLLDKIQDIVIPFERSKIPDQKNVLRTQKAAQILAAKTCSDDVFSISSGDQQQESQKRKAQNNKIHKLSGRQMINEMHINRQISTQHHLSRQDTFFPLFSMHSYILPPQNQGSQEKVYIQKVSDLRIKNDVIEVKIQWKQKGISQTWLDLNVAKMLDKQMIVEAFVQEYLKCCLQQTKSTCHDRNQENKDKGSENNQIGIEKNKNSKTHWRIAN